MEKEQAPVGLGSLLIPSSSVMPPRSPFRHPLRTVPAILAIPNIAFYTPPIAMLTPVTYTFRRRRRAPPGRPRDGIPLDACANTYGRR